MEAAQPFVHIKPRKGWQLIDLRELIQYSDLFYFLTLRDIKVKYKQTVLGGAWALIQPLFSMLVFTLFFGKLARMPSDGIPYPVFCYTAMVVWTFFSNAVSGAGNSLVGNANLLSKVYFPRLIIPLAPIQAGLLDFAIAFVLLLGLLVIYGISPSVTILSLPFLILLMILTASGTGMFLAALNAKYRDIRYAIPFLVQLWMFASPIVYPASLVPERYRLLYAFNPLTGIIEGFRACLLSTGPFPMGLVAVSTLVSVALFGMGLTYFKQTERHFADII